MNITDNGPRFQLTKNNFESFLLPISSNLCVFRKRWIDQRCSIYKFQFYYCDCHQNSDSQCRTNTTETYLKKDEEHSKALAKISMAYLKMCIMFYLN